ncbi:MAG TPA: NUDIX domain-containing protein [Candidatus Saccharimonadia bacterium]|jgi:ADP-ribose pyrophosphatase YjhB (NUDIX family)
MQNSIRVGLGLVLLNSQGKILLHQRKSQNGRGEWGGPGGELGYLEDFEYAIKREVAEECGKDVVIGDLRALCVINYRGKRDAHWVGIGYSAKLVSGEPRLLEPEKQGGWQWFSLDELPSPLFTPMANYIESHKTGKICFQD